MRGTPSRIKFTRAIRWVGRLVIAGVLALLPATARAQSGSISGTVTDEVTGAGLDAMVFVYNAVGGRVTDTRTGAGGAYIVTGLAAGTYFAMTWVNVPFNIYVGEAYDDHPCPVNCAPTITATTPITVSAGATVFGITFRLSRGGGIAGTVTDVDTGAPLRSASVEIYVANGSPAAYATTNASGLFTATGLFSGTYHARASVEGYIDEAYDDVPCARACALNPAAIVATTPIAVTMGATSSGISFALSPLPRGSISGRVTAEDGVPAYLLSVSAYSARGDLISFGWTDFNGFYLVPGLAAGTYFVRTTGGGPPRSGSSLLDEAYDNIACALSSCTVTAATPVVVSDGAVTSGIDFSLPRGGLIVGTVTEAGSGVGISNLAVELYSASGILVMRTTVLGHGYDIGALPTGTYFARVVVPSGLNYVDEAYDGVPCGDCTVTAATPISVTAGVITSAIDFALSPGGVIAGTVTDAGTGAPLREVTIQVFSARGTLVKAETSDAAGFYAVMGLHSGTYFVRTSVGTTYVPQLYHHTACPFAACSVTAGTPVVVAAGTTRGGVDFRLKPTGTADIAVDFGPSYGLWLLSADSRWRLLHGISPAAMVTGDLDGNGRDDLVVDFGPSVGVFAWMNHATWVWLHPFSPTQMVTGDLDGNGHDDVVMVFAGYGVWRWSDGVWNLIHALDGARLATGQLDGLGGQELIIDFPGFGLFVYANNHAWWFLHGLPSSALVTADLDGDGRDELVIDFPGVGLWVYRGPGTWTLLHGLSPTHIAGGHLDVNPRADLAIDFGPAFGVWTYRNDEVWVPLHGRTSYGIRLANRDAMLGDEVLIDFGVGAGLWQYANDRTWSLLHGLKPEGLTTGQLH